MNDKISLSEKEMAFMQDTDFLLTRRKIDDKINQLFVQTEEEIKQFLQNNSITFPDGVKFRAGKIAKGENYRQLPYYMLDYPRQFSRSSIFALRTMFWWGHYFSVTFHISGSALNKLRPALQQNIHKLVQEDIYLYVNQEDPWQHHIAAANYQRMKDVDGLTKLMTELEHVKLSSILSLNEWNHLPDFALNFFRQMLMLVSLYEESM